MSAPQQPVAYGCYRHPDRPTYIRCQRCGRPICGDCMISAAVGFQCPECVAAGARDTRQNEGSYGGLRSTNPAATTITLIAINAAIWVAILLTGGSGSKLGDQLALLPSGRCNSLGQPGSYYPNATQSVCTMLSDGSWQPGVAQGDWWQLLTSAFTHVEPLHIGFNMLALWFLGPTLERALGRARFLAVYLLAALAGSTAVLWLSDPQSQTLGASGAIFGLLGALLVIAHKVHGDVRNILVWLGINIAFTFMGNGISWQGHIGGLIGGALAAAIIVYAPRKDRTRTQWLGLAGVLVVLLVLIAVRVAQLG
ncbi:MAG: rhomboid family intramembrane serine protease [Propionicimonas sp.]|uniref:rhomboid family intramembrane serine protease n=1 Tax=Propionicimonas sp. TaxID=1955623 RepID=UPI003D14235D